MIQLYWLPCPECSVKSLVDTDRLGQAGIRCETHGFTLIPRRVPPADERIERPGPKNPVTYRPHHRQGVSAPFGARSKMRFGRGE